MTDKLLDHDEDEDTDVDPDDILLTKVNDEEVLGNVDIVEDEDYPVDALVHTQNEAREEDDVDPEKITINRTTSLPDDFEDFIAPVGADEEEEEGRDDDAEDSNAILLRKQNQRKRRLKAEDEEDDVDPESINLGGGMKWTREEISVPIVDSDEDGSGKQPRRKRTKAVIEDDDVDPDDLELSAKTQRQCVQAGDETVQDDNRVKRAGDRGKARSKSLMKRRVLELSGSESDGSESDGSEMKLTAASKLSERMQVVEEMDNHTQARAVEKEETSLRVSIGGHRVTESCLRELII